MTQKGSNCKRAGKRGKKSRWPEYLLGTEQNHKEVQQTRAPLSFSSDPSPCKASMVPLKLLQISQFKTVRKEPCLSPGSAGLLFLRRWRERGSLVQEFLFPKRCKILVGKLSLTAQFACPASPPGQVSSWCLPWLFPQTKGCTSLYFCKRVNGGSCTSSWEMPLNTQHYSL